MLYTTICGAQINEIDAVKGPDKFLPHLLGHEAAATVIETGLGVVNVKPATRSSCTGGQASASSARRRHIAGAVKSSMLVG